MITKNKEMVKVELYDRNFIFKKVEYFAFAPLLHVKVETILGRLFKASEYSFAIITNPRSKKIAIFKSFYESIWIFLDGELDIENRV